MPIPDYETLMGPLLRIAEANKGKAVSLPHAIEQLAGQFKLTEEEKSELLPSGGTFKISSHVSWARTYLQKVSFISDFIRSYDSLAEYFLLIKSAFFPNLSRVR